MEFIRCFKGWIGIWFFSRIRTRKGYFVIIGSSFGFFLQIQYFSQMPNSYPFFGVRIRSRFLISGSEPDLAYSWGLDPDSHLISLSRVESGSNFFLEARIRIWFHSRGLYPHQLQPGSGLITIRINYNPDPDQLQPGSG